MYIYLIWLFREKVIVIKGQTILHQSMRQLHAVDDIVLQGHLHNHKCHESQRIKQKDKRSNNDLL